MHERDAFLIFRHTMKTKALAILMYAALLTTFYIAFELIGKVGSTGIQGAP